MYILFQAEGTEVSSKEMLAKSTFTEMDKNGDGKVKKQQPNQKEKTFTEMDKNRDGTLGR